MPVGSTRLFGSALSLLRRKELVGTGILAEGSGFREEHVLKSPRSVAIGINASVNTFVCEFRPLTIRNASPQVERFGLTNITSEFGALCAAFYALADRAHADMCTIFPRPYLSGGMDGMGRCRGREEQGRVKHWKPDWESHHTQNRISGRVSGVHEEVYRAGIRSPQPARVNP